MAIKNLWRRKARTILTAGGIAIGIAVVVTLLALANGLSSDINALVGHQGADLCLMQAGVADMMFSVLDKETGESIAAMPEIQWVAGLLIQIIPIEQKPYFVVLGVDLRGPASEHFRNVQGESALQSGQLLLGQMAADYLNKAPGDQLTLQGKTYSIAGIYETGVGYEDAGAVLALDEAQRLFRKEGLVSLYQVKLYSEFWDQADRIVQRIESDFAQVKAYPSAEFAQNTPDIQSFQALAGAMSLVGLLAGALGTMNTMLMSVTERTREIGTLRALGWRKRQVLGLIMQEAITLSLLGGLVGMLLGVGLVRLIGFVPALQGYMNGQVTPAVLASGGVIALALGTLGSLYPAWRAACMQPIEALRYE
jgi:putative ABC transport system permease protein